ncbi:MAG: hypothetical protein H0W62_06765 [Chitinophagales bacterium]|nr:hypothetical protein [Chitinophagales bacterium]
MESSGLTYDLIKKIRAASAYFGNHHTDEKKQLLLQAGKCKIKNVSTLVAYHDCLLFLLAYPETKELLHMARNELLRVGMVSKKFSSGVNKRNSIQLVNTGVVWSKIQVSFSYDLIKWLIHEYRGRVQLFSIDANPETVRNIILHGLTDIEYESWLSKKLSIQKCIQHLKKDNNLSDLEFLLLLFENINCTNRIRDTLFESLELFVQWSLDEDSPSKTFARSLKRNLFFHKSALYRKVNSTRLINQPIAKSSILSSAEKKHLITIARGILSMFLRETDPVTYADADRVELYDMKRGIDVALYPMISARRLSLESYIGYQSFKNQIPVAYGGGWIFEYSCKIGINIFEAFRGGESAYLFSQILRLYRWRFNIKQFVIEPYQLGKNNLEGLQSGAFWFYYRLGFLPENGELKLLAEKEFIKITEIKTYRSSIEVMKRLADSNMILDLDPNNSFLNQDVSKWSNLITYIINTCFNGNRRQAEEYSMKLLIDNLDTKPVNWNRSEHSLMKNLSVLLASVPHLNKWTLKDKQKLLKWLQAKENGSEMESIQLFQKHKMLINSLRNLMENPVKAISSHSAMV